ncbi:MAG: hypothetical protein ACOC9N_02180 [Gemmatimonadota bacterium]
MLKLDMKFDALLFVLLAAVTVGCDDEPGDPTPIEPEPGDSRELLVLNSTGQTIAPFEVNDSLAEDGEPIDLGGAFDGTTVDATETHAVTTISEFGGSRVLFADLESGTVTTVEFLPPEGLSANPSRATFDDAGAAWFAGRGSDVVYTAAPGDATATAVTADVGTFVEAVLPVGSELAAIDAFIDDDGETFAPLGPSRVFVIDAIGALIDEITLPDEARNALGGVVVDGRLVVLLGGTLDPNTFAPMGDGGLVVVDVADRSTGSFVPLEGNGVTIEAGEDGLVYAVTTDDFVATSLVSFDPATGNFVAGPSAPIDVRDGSGADVNCWVATALEDGRLLCATFNSVEEGSLLLLDDDGSAIDEIASGFGSTDILLR